MSDTFVERQSRLVSLVYQVLGTMEPPPLETSEVEVLAALASAFHHKAQSIVEAVFDRAQGKPAPQPKHTRMVSTSVPLLVDLSGPEEDRGNALALTLL